MRCARLQAELSVHVSNKHIVILSQFAFQIPLQAPDEYISVDVTASVVPVPVSDVHAAAGGGHELSGDPNQYEQPANDIAFSYPDGHEEDSQEGHHQQGCNSIDTFFVPKSGQ